MFFGQMTHLREECRFSFMNAKMRTRAGRNCVASEVGHAGVHLYCRMEPRVIDAVDWFVPDVATLPPDSQSFGSFPMV